MQTKNIILSVFLCIALAMLFTGSVTKIASAQTSVIPQPSTSSIPTSPSYLPGGTKDGSTAALAAVTVRAPNGGETWLTNSTQLISWNSQLFVATFATPTAKIEWVKESGESGVIAETAPATQFGGAYGWNIPNDFPTGAYKIRITLFDAVDSSDAYFTIATSTSVVPASTPTSTAFSVKVLYPNGGEKFTGDQTIAMNWQLMLPSILFRGIVRQPLSGCEAMALPKQSSKVYLLLGRMERM